MNPLTYVDALRSLSAGAFGPALSLQGASAAGLVCLSGLVVDLRSMRAAAQPAQRRAVTPRVGGVDTCSAHS